MTKGKVIFSLVLFLGLFPAQTPAKPQKSLPAMNSGLERRTASRIIISDNTLYGNNSSAIHIRGNRVRIEKCRIYQNGNAGIVVNNDAQVNIRQNQIYNQEGTGIAFMGKGSARIIIADNQIYQNKMAGLHFGGKDRISPQNFMKNPTAQIVQEEKQDEDEKITIIEVRDNRIYSNADGGLKCQTEYQGQFIYLSVSNNIFSKNQKGGIFIADKVKGIVYQNSICENGKAGIAANKEEEYSPQLDVHQNTIRGNEKAGLDITAAGSGSTGICNNWILNNGGSGIRFKVTPMRIVNNTIVSNGSLEEGSGIEQQGKEKSFFIANNILAYNFTTGISLKKRGDCSHNLLYANDGGGTCCDDCYTSSKIVANKQLGGGKRREGDLICDPVFQNPDLFDFRLKEWSPAIDAGIPSPEFQDHSFLISLGTLRNDMGATGGPLAISWDPNHSTHAVPRER